MPLRDDLNLQRCCGLALCWHTHPMGEARHKVLAARRGGGDEPSPPLVVDTLGGRMHVRWDEGAAATPHGQLVFFSEFLAATYAFSKRTAAYANVARIANDGAAAISVSAGAGGSGPWPGAAKTG